VGYSQSVVTLTSTPTLIATVAPDAWALLYNPPNYAQEIFIGDSSVGLFGTPNQGVKIAPGAEIMLPAVPGQANEIYGVVSTSAIVVVLTPDV
jgi:hypothetical protein